MAVPATVARFARNSVVALRAHGALDAQRFARRAFWSRIALNPRSTVETRVAQGALLAGSTLEAVETGATLFSLVAWKTIGSILAPFASWPFVSKISSVALDTGVTRLAVLTGQSFWAVRAPVTFFALFTDWSRGPAYYLPFFRSGPESVAARGTRGSGHTPLPFLALDTRRHGTHYAFITWRSWVSIRTGGSGVAFLASSSWNAWFSWTTWYARNPCITRVAFHANGVDATFARVAPGSFEAGYPSWSVGSRSAW